VRYRRKFAYCEDGHKTDVPETSQYRHFCEKHRTRGNAAFDDADQNYTTVPIEMPE